MQNPMSRLDSSQFNWTLLRSFLAIYTTGSVAAAARLLAMQQPTLSRQLSELENQLAVTLFERSSKGLYPTAAARQIYPFAAEMAKSASQLCLALSDLGAELQGTVRIYATQVIATTLLPTVLADMLLEQPGLQIELVATDETPDLLQRDADIGFWLSEPQTLDLVSRKLGNVSIVAMASTDYLKRYGTPQSLDDLSGHRFLGHDRLDVMLQWFKQFNLMPDRYHFSFRTDDKPSYIEALKAGAGIGFVSQYLLKKQSGLQQVLPALPLPEFGVWLVTHRDVSNNKLIKAVYDRLTRDITQILLAEGATHGSA